MVVMFHRGGLWVSMIFFAYFVGNVYLLQIRVISVVLEIVDKKLKMVELQLKKQKIDQGNKDGPAIEESDGFVISDRNELMKKLLKKD